MEESKKEIGITVTKDKDFSEWYQQVILKSDLADYSAVGGCIVFRPYSYAIWEKVVKAVDDRLKAMGVKNAYFPLLIPERLLKKEAEHLKGFSPEVAWVDYAGDTKLEERLAVRPTSETIMYDSYAKWIRSWRDLPLKINQWNSVVRWEFKHAVPFLRTREFLWNEGHTVFADKKEAEKECIDILNMYREILEEYFALYNLPGKKTDREKFAGAEYTFSLEIYMPNGRAIQGPDSHHDGENFAKAFNIKFLDKDGKEKFAIQNTWAITTRMLGVLFAVHGDDKGLVLPPKLAPIQIVIVPIFFKESEKEKIMKKAEELKSKLKDYSVELDAREEFTPGYKFNEWELKGIPIRIEIGPKDIEKDQAVLVRRDSGKKEAVRIADLAKKIKETLDDIQDSLFQKSKKLTEDNIVKTGNWNELTKAIENKKLVLAPSCGTPECEDLIKDKTGGAKALNIPFDQPKSIGKCVHCGKEGKYLVYLGKSY
ncbi:MAG: proline--tRNA ligase [Candidatus Woesearchaeota archaeon]|nr:proline--tRNA ligase [Candidatus Woesearchaeota archaeon]